MIITTATATARAPQPRRSPHPLQSQSDFLPPAQFASTSDLRVRVPCAGRSQFYPACARTCSTSATMEQFIGSNFAWDKGELLDVLSGVLLPFCAAEYSTVRSLRASSRQLHQIIALPYVYARASHDCDHLQKVLPLLRFAKGASVFPTIPNHPLNRDWLLQELKATQTLQRLTVALELLRGQDANNIDVFRHNSSITRLGIAGDALGSRDLQGLTEDLAGAPRLTRLNASLQVTSAAWLAAGSFLAKNTTIRSLSISSSASPNGVANPFFSSLLQNSIIQELSLTCCQSPARSGALGRALAGNCSLRTLSLAYSNTDHKDCADIAHSLRYNTNLTELILEDNAVGPEGAAALGVMLTCNSTLRLLHVGENLIDTEGGLHIARALLIRNTTLTVLNLQRNYLHGCSATFGALIAKSKTLKDLDLSANNWKPDGVASLARALGANVALEKLGLAYSGCDGTAVQCLANALKLNTVLTQLDISGNPFIGSDIRAIAEAMKSNSSLRFLIARASTPTTEGMLAFFSGLPRHCILSVVDLTGHDIDLAQIQQLLEQDNRASTFSSIRTQPPQVVHWHSD